MNKFNNLFWKNKYLKIRLLRHQMFIVHSGSIRTHPWPEYCEVTSHNPWLDNDCQIKHFCDIWVFDRYQGIWWIWEVVRKLLLRSQCCLDAGAVICDVMIEYAVVIYHTIQKYSTFLLWNLWKKDHNIHWDTEHINLVESINIKWIHSWKE